MGQKEKNMLPSQVLHERRADILNVMKRYPMFGNLRVVGSVARGEDAEGSDIDFLVDPLPDATLFHLGGLYEDLQEFLGVSVDILTTGGEMNDYMKMTITRDAVPL